MRPPFRIRLLALAALAVPAACASDPDPGPRRDSAHKVHVVDGLAFPESVRYDPELDVYFVSSMQGPGSVKDSNGYITRIAAGDLRRVETLVHSDMPGVTLHAPKGLAVQGDTLWVADIDVLRAFHRRDGRALGAIDLRPYGAVLLNDVAVGPDGTLRVTDTGIVMTNLGVMYHGGEKIFAIGPGRSVSLMTHG